MTRAADRMADELAGKCGATRSADGAVLTKRARVRAHPHAWDGTCYASKRFAANCVMSKLPESYDWSALGATTPIKDQGDCGDCFTFGETADCESAWFLSGRDLVSLSEQQLTSCDRVGEDGGCGGNDSSSFARRLCFLLARGLGHPRARVGTWTRTST